GCRGASGNTRRSARASRTGGIRMGLRRHFSEQSDLGRMGLHRIAAAVCAAAFLLGGCSFTDEALFPSLGSDAPATRQAATATDPAGTEGAPAFNTGSFEPGGVTHGAPTGTFVGHKVEELRGDLERLQSSVAGQNQALQQLRAGAVQ